MCIKIVFQWRPIGDGMNCMQILLERYAYSEIGGTFILI